MRSSSKNVKTYSQENVLQGKKKEMKIKKWKMSKNGHYYGIMKIKK